MSLLRARCRAVSKWVADDGPPTCELVAPTRWSRAALHVLERVHPEPLGERTMVVVVVGADAAPPPGALAVGLGAAPLVVSAGGQTLAMTLLNSLLRVGAAPLVISLVVELRPAAELALAVLWSVDGPGPSVSLDRAAPPPGSSTRAVSNSENPCRAAVSLFETLRSGKGIVELPWDGSSQWGVRVT